MPEELKWMKRTGGRALVEVWRCARGVLTVVALDKAAMR